jgi:hypothetical protein
MFNIGNTWYIHNSYSDIPDFNFTPYRLKKLRKVTFEMEQAQKRFIKKTRAKNKLARKHRKLKNR